jgi:group I intron endonuclease
MHVYCITNTVNGKIYIGQHVGDDLEWYLRQNVCRAIRRNTAKPHLFSAIRKYGADKFVIRSLVCPIDKDQMSKLEIFFIRVLETRDREIGYNLTDGGDGQHGNGKPHTEEWKKNNSRLHKGRKKPPRSLEWRAKQSQIQSGKPKSEEFKKHLREVRTGWKFSDQTKERISKALTGRVFSKEWRDKLSAAQHKRWEKKEVPDGIIAH